ncbi:MAG: prepilin peptidase [Candidatus Thorarchaeota archaeon]
MAFYLDSISALAFIMTLCMLLLMSIEDLRKRSISNELMLVFGIGGVFLGLWTGHIQSEPILHLTAVVFVLGFSYLLFRLKAVGGADVKTLLNVAIISPGIEFTNWYNPVFESVIASLGQILLMLCLGYIWWRKVRETETRPPALIPLLLVGYLIVQLLALF